MAVSKKILHEEIKARYMALVCDYFRAQDEEVLVTGSNKFAIPVVDSQGNEEFLEVTLKVPTGSRDGDPYDGYGEAESYSMKLKEKAEKAEASAKKKAEKIAKDNARRAKKNEANEGES